MRRKNASLRRAWWETQIGLNQAKEVSCAKALGKGKNMCSRNRLKTAEAEAQECKKEQHEMQLKRWVRGLTEASNATVDLISNVSLCYMWYNLPMNFLKITNGSYNTLIAPSCLTCPVTPSYLTLWDPMDCSTPGLPVLHRLPEFAQTHALSRRCHPTIPSSVVPFSFCLQSFPASLISHSNSNPSSIYLKYLSLERWGLRFFVCISNQEESTHISSPHKSPGWSLQ